MSNKDIDKNIDTYIGCTDKMIYMCVKAIHEHYTAMLCAMCGFPNCKCVICSKKGNLSGSATMPHECWRAEYGSGHANYNYSTNSTSQFGKE